MPSVGSPVLLDAWSKDYLMPVTDVKQGGRSDTTLLAAAEMSGSTLLQFTRPLVTGDSVTDYPIGNSSMFLLWAYSAADGVGDQYGKHDFCGSSPVQFIASAGGSSGPTVDPSTVLAGVEFVVCLADQSCSSVCQLQQQFPCVVVCGHPLRPSDVCHAGCHDWLDQCGLY